MTKITYIPGEIANAAIDEHGNRKPVTRTHHIFDDVKNKNQAQINADVDSTFAFHQSEINALNSQNYVTVDSFSSLPTTGAVDTVYRVSNWDGTQQDPSVYSEYAWNGEDYVHLSTKTQIGEVFDISAYHATGGTLATYADLSAALDSNNGGGVPQSLQKGGMSVKFIQGTAQSSDDKYVQYMLTKNTWSISVDDWEKINLETEYYELGKNIGIDINNFVDGIFVEKQGYMRNDGTIHVSSEWHCYIVDFECKSGDIFNYKGYGLAAAYSCIIYDSGNNIVDAQQYNSTSSYTPITIPSDGVRIRISSFASVNSNIVLSVYKNNGLFDLVDKLTKNTSLSLQTINGSISTINQSINTVNQSLNTTNKNIDDKYNKINMDVNSNTLFTEQGGYLKNDGTYGGNPAQLHSKSLILDCNPGDEFYYKGKNGAAAYAYVVYNGDTIIDAQQVGNTTSFTKVSMPSNATKVLFSSYDNVGTEVIFEVRNGGNVRILIDEIEKQVEFNIKDVLYKKKWLAVGDSFTNGDYSHDTTGTYLFASGKYAGLNKVYPRFIALRNDMNLVMDAVNGSTMAVATDYVDNPQNDPHSPYSYQRYLNIPADVDYITIWFGINDANYCTLGTINDSTIGTFYGAWNVVMEWIITNRPNTKVGIVVTNLSTSSYRQATREIAKKWGIPYLDMMGDPQVPDIFGKESTGYSTAARDLRIAHWRVGPDNAHPNQFAHEYESTFIENWLRTL